METFEEEKQTDLPKIRSLGLIYLLKYLRILLIFLFSIGALVVLFNFTFSFFFDRRIVGDCGNRPGMHEPKIRWVYRFSHGESAHLHPSYLDMIRTGRGSQIIDEMFEIDYPPQFNYNQEPVIVDVTF